VKISVVLANYNHARYLEQNIAALQAQSHRDWELIVIDDGSTDESWPLIERLCAADPRIKAERFASNRGAITAARRGFELATGDLLYWSAADDYIENPRFFALAAEALERHPQAAGAFGRSRVVDGGDDRELWVMGSAPAGAVFIAPRAATEGFLKGTLFVPGAAAVWKPRLFDELGGLDPALGPQSDYYVNHALPALHGVVFIDQVLSVTRRFEASYSARSSDDDFFRFHALVERKFRSLPFSEPIPEEWFRVWRANVLEGRLVIWYQREFVARTRAFLARLSPSEQASLPPRFQDCRDYLLHQCDALESELSKRIATAERIFNTIAGLRPIE
jgi:glycosyltransferase involved in cell wall biosynthesis